MALLCGKAVPPTTPSAEMIDIMGGLGDNERDLVLVTTVTALGGGWRGTLADLCKILLVLLILTQS